MLKGCLMCVLSMMMPEIWLTVGGGNKHHHTKNRNKMKQGFSIKWIGSSGPLKCTASSWIVYVLECWYFNWFGCCPFAQCDLLGISAFLFYESRFAWLKCGNHICRRIKLDVDKVKKMELFAGSLLHLPGVELYLLISYSWFITLISKLSTFSSSLRSLSSSWSYQ